MRMPDGIFQMVSSVLLLLVRSCVMSVYVNWPGESTMAYYFELLLPAFRRKRQELGLTGHTVFSHTAVITFLQAP